LFQPEFDNISNSQRQDGFYKLKCFLRETYYTGRVEKTTSYTTLPNHTKCNVRKQAEDIIQHVLKLHLGDNANYVWEDIIKHNKYDLPVNQR